MRSNLNMEDIPGDVIKIINGIKYQKGDKAILRLGQRRSDASDILLDGKIVTIEVIYTDYNDQYHIAVTMDDDPGQEMLRELGIYRYFVPEELELITDNQN